MSGSYPGERTDLSCGECGAPMRLRTSVYGPFYGCSQYPDCNGVHGGHPDGSPLGTPADAKTRSAHSLAHAAFDRLWREAPRYRRLRVRGPARARLQQQQSSRTRPKRKPAERGGRGERPLNPHNLTVCPLGRSVKGYFLHATWVWVVK